jgi:hypothetical protein
MLLVNNWQQQRVFKLKLKSSSCKEDLSHEDTWDYWGLKQAALSIVNMNWIPIRDALDSKRFAYSNLALVCL